MNKTGEYGSTPLFKAIWNGHVEVVKLLLSAPGVDVNKAGSTFANPATPLNIACSKDHTEIVELLLAAPGIDINSTLAEACRLCRRGSKLPVVRRLLRVPGIDPNTRDERGFTPLMIATLHHQKDLIRVLMKDRRVEYHKTVSLTALDMADMELNEDKSWHAELKKEMKGTIDRRKIEHQRELARMMHRKQIEEGHGQFKKAPTQVLKHAGTFLDHEIKTKLKF